MRLIGIKNFQKMRDSKVTVKTDLGLLTVKKLSVI